MSAVAGVTSILSSIVGILVILQLTFPQTIKLFDSYTLGIPMFDITYMAWVSLHILSHGIPYAIALRFPPVEGGKGEKYKADLVQAAVMDATGVDISKAYPAGQNRETSATAVPPHVGGRNSNGGRIVEIIEEEEEEKKE